MKWSEKPAGRLETSAAGKCEQQAATKLMNACDPVTVSYIVHKKLEEAKFRNSIPAYMAIFMDGKNMPSDCNSKCAEFTLNLNGQRWFFSSLRLVGKTKRPQGFLAIVSLFVRCVISLWDDQK